MIIRDWLLCYDEYEPLPCQSPCTLYGVLYQHRLIPDPFYGMNERNLQFLADKDCTFLAFFTVAEDVLEKEYIELIFHGLDTLCSIYLNNRLLARVKNMHRTYRYEVKSLLQPGENCLRLEFQSPTRYFARQQAKHYLYMNDGDTLPGAAHLRKAMYQSGWDWGPTLPDMGIFRSVELRAYDTDRLDTYQIRQLHDGKEVQLEIEVTTAKNSQATVVVTIDGQSVPLRDGFCRICIPNPRLWWVRGYGEQPLYDVDIELFSEDRLIDSIHTRIGLRTLTVSTRKDPDGSGREFCFVNNGVKIFSMGANLIPLDNLLGRVTPQRWKETVLQALDGNFNTLRVWGGGYYPDDCFFELCDEHGILVWQDFMVACANIYLTEEMKEEFRQEITDNLLRFRHHACLGILVGNNEMEDMIINAGAQNTELVRADYLQLYEHLMPELCEKLAPDIFYWPSSPSSGGGFEDPGNPLKGDSHYWGVWHGNVPFSEYRKYKFRFCSEYGFESFPSLKTIRIFCPEEELNCFSPIMENHQKCKGGNGKILRYLADTYLYPHSFENLIYASQLVQADAIKYGVEHFRRNRGYCMGSIYWQFNDCWPVASWSGVDSFGRYKALHYAAKKFYAPVAMGLFLEDQRLTVNISNETREDFQGSILLTLCKNDFQILDRTLVPVRVSSLTASDELVYQPLCSDPDSTYITVDLLDAEGCLIMRQVELFVPPKHFRWLPPSFDTTFTAVGEEIEIAVSGTAFAKSVFLDFENFDCVLSENYFDITDPSPYRIKVKTDRCPEELKENLRIKSVYDIR